jgi:hypothetical protein
MDVPGRCIRSRRPRADARLRRGLRMEFRQPLAVLSPHQSPRPALAPRDTGGRRHEHRLYSSAAEACLAKTVLPADESIHPSAAITNVPEAPRVDSQGTMLPRDRRLPHTKGSSPASKALNRLRKHISNAPLCPYHLRRARGPFQLSAEAKTLPETLRSKPRSCGQERRHAQYAIL